VIVGVGVDVVEVARLARSLERTPSLLVAKVLGAPGLAWVEAEVVPEESGRPTLVLHGEAAAFAAKLGIARWHLSLSHDGGMATAFVVGESA